MTSNEKLYQELETGYIRLLKLRGTCSIETDLPGVQDVAIDCTMHTVSMADIKANKVSYYALSYTWGYVDAGRTIVCNSHRKQVTRNLYDGLWEFVHSPAIGKNYLWIDAICINQELLAEKTVQVGMMSDIYRSADLVVVWLGVRASESADVDKHWKLARGRESDGQELSEGSKWNGVFEHALSESSSEDMASWPDAEEAYDTNSRRRRPRLVNPMYDIRIVEESYWVQRMWTFQEIALARKVRFHYGPYITNIFEGPNRPQDITKSVELAGDPDATPPQHQIREIVAYDTVSGYVLPSPGDVFFSHLLQVTSHRTCSNPLDKIYALLGVLEYRTRLQPDYDQTPLDVCAQVTLMLSEELDCLYLGQSMKGASWPDSDEVDDEPMYYTESDYSRTYETSVTQAGPDSAGISWIRDWTAIGTAAWLKKPQCTFEYPALHSSFVRSGSFDNTTGRLLARGILLGRWRNSKRSKPKASEVGNFTRFPACIWSARSDFLIDPEQHQGTSRVGLKPTYFCAAVVLQLWHQHQAHKCSCAEMKTRTAEVEQTSRTQPAYLCLIFGCPHLLVVRQSSSDGSAILGVLSVRIGWSRALQHISKLRILQAVDRKTETQSARRGVSEYVGVKALPGGSTILEPLQPREAMDSFEDLSIDGDDNNEKHESESDNTQLDWIPTTFKLEGRLPQQRADIWGPPKLPQISYQASDEDRWHTEQNRRPNTRTAHTRTRPETHRRRKPGQGGFLY